MQEFLEAHIRDHKAIYEAVKDKNLRLAERRIEEHNLQVGRSLLFRLKPNDKNKNDEDID
jgi:DNA-binding GntR family transcriptional regulator